jgi:hypothetical protein
MKLTWLLGYVLAAGFLWGGLSKHNKLRSSTKQLFTVVGVFVLILIIAMTLDDLFKWWNRFPKELIGVAGIAIVIERSVRLARAPRLGGLRLLDLGRIPGQDMIINLFVGLGLAWFSVMDIVAIVQSHHWAFRTISFHILGLSISYAVLIQAFSKRRLVEQGVFFGTGLCPYVQIESFDWEHESATSSILVLHKRTSIPVFHFTTVSIKAELTGAVEEVLRQHAIPRIEEAPKPPPEGEKGMQ